MGVYATPQRPKDSEFVAVGAPLVAYHTYSSDGLDNESGDDYEQAHQERYRLVGAGAWTELAVVMATGYTVYPALAAGSYERQVKAQSNNSGAWGAYSASAFFTVTAQPATPTITAPAAAAVISTGTVSMAWTAAAFTAYQIEVRTATGGAGTLEWTSGIVLSTATSATVTLPTSGGARYVRVRIRNNGVWSNWAERQITSSWLAPMTPTVVVTPVDADGIGMLHALNITATHPTPSGGAPAVAAMDIYAKAVDAAGLAIGSEYLVLGSQTPTGTKTWRTPAAQRYAIRVVGKAADGRTASSGTVLTSAALAFKGFLLHDPDDVQVTIRGFRYNDEGASDSYDVDAQLIDYQGREFPVAEFGTSSKREVSVDLIHSKGSGDARALLNFVKLRKVLCYRDSKGRKLYGLLKLGATRDTIYGFTTGVTITQTDFPADRETY